MTSIASEPALFPSTPQSLAASMPAPHEGAMRQADVEAWQRVFQQGQAVRNEGAPPDTKMNGETRAPQPADPRRQPSRERAEAPTKHDARTARQHPASERGRAVAVPAKAPPAAERTASLATLPMTSAPDTVRTSLANLSRTHMSPAQANFGVAHRAHGSQHADPQDIVAAHPGYTMSILASGERLTFVLRNTQHHRPNEAISIAMSAARHLPEDAGHLDQVVLNGKTIWRLETPTAGTPGDTLEFSC